MSTANGIRLLAISVGRALPLFVAAQGTEAVLMSGIRKHPLSTLLHPLKVVVRPLGLRGDEQADLSVHGGLDRAIYAYPAEHYAWWNERRREARLPGGAKPLAHGAMGENLTLEGVLETDLWVGDRLRIGDVLLEVESPRRPCHKFNAVMGYRHAIRHMVQSGYSGVYFSVVKPGELSAGAEVRLEPGPRQMSIESINARLRNSRQHPLF
jgi:MOSC domain-containing protein YiiM